MLKQAIKDSGESRAHWAEKLGISKPYLSDLLNGKKQPSLEMAVKIERETGGAVPATSWIPVGKIDQSVGGAA